MQRDCSLLYHLSYIPKALLLLDMAGLEPATEGVVSEVTLCYGTCHTIFYNSRRAHGLRERNHC